MNKSVNSVFAQMGIDVGMTEVMKVAGELGMDTEGEQAVPAQTLGSMGASPLEMAGVYATLDNHGKKVTPQIVKSVEHKDRTIDIPEAIGEQIISEQAADTVTSVLTGVVDDGTARTSVRENPLRDGQQVAGKTGTSDDNKSAWFTGFTPTWSPRSASSARTPRATPRSRCTRPAASTTASTAVASPRRSGRRTPSASWTRSPSSTWTPSRAPR